MNTFAVGQRVVVGGFEKPILGTVVAYSYDEGHVWMVRTDGGNLWDCGSDELFPA